MGISGQPTKKITFTSQIHKMNEPKKSLKIYIYKTYERNIINCIN